MSGHSKWASIKHQKAATDKKRSSSFTKLANNISVAARAGGDPEMNYSLRLAIDKAKQANMPKDNIDRAVKRGTGELDGAQLENITYEVYGPSGSAIIVEALTDNKNRTAAEVKAILNRHGGKLAASGAVTYLFQRRGQIVICIEGQGTDDAELKIIDSGAEEYHEDEGSFIVYANPANLEAIAKNIADAGLKINSKEIVLEPKEMVKLDEETTNKVIKLLEALDELDDVIEVNSNLG